MRQPLVFKNILFLKTGPVMGHAGVTFRAFMELQLLKFVKYFYL